MIVTPDNEIVVPPVKIAIQPQANRKADAERDKGRAIPGLIINLVRLINRHINHLWVSRNNFNLAAVINHLLLRRGLQVAKVICRRAQPLAPSCLPRTINITWILPSRPSRRSARSTGCWDWGRRNCSPGLAHDAGLVRARRFEVCYPQRGAWRSCAAHALDRRAHTT